MYVSTVTDGTIFAGMTLMWIDQFGLPVNPVLMPATNYIESQVSGNTGGAGTYTIRYPILYTTPQNNLIATGSLTSTTYTMSTASSIVNMMKSAKII